MLAQLRLLGTPGKCLITTDWAEGNEAQPGQQQHSHFHRGFSWPHLPGLSCCTRTVFIANRAQEANKTRGSGVRVYTTDAWRENTFTVERQFIFPKAWALSVKMSFILSAVSIQKIWKIYRNISWVFVCKYTNIKKNVVLLNNLSRYVFMSLCVDERKLKTFFHQ